MANIKISELTDARTLSGNELIAIDQFAVSPLVDYNTVKIQLSGVKDYIYTDVPSITVPSIAVNGAVDTNSIDADAGTISSITTNNICSTNSLDVDGTATFNSVILSGGFNLSDIIEAGGERSLQNVTDIGADTTNKITVQNTVSACNFIGGSNNEVIPGTWVDSSILGGSYNTINNKIVLLVEGNIM